MQTMGTSKQKLDEQTDRLGELNSYRQMYKTKTHGNGAVAPAHWQDYQQFLARLDLAVQSQQQIVKDGERDLATHKRRWMAKRQRLESLERVIERYQREEQVGRDRLEQKVQDDLPKMQNSFMHKS